MSAIPPSPLVNRTTKNVADHGDQLVPIDLYPSRRLFCAQMLGLLVPAVAVPLALKDHWQQEPFWWLMLGFLWSLLALGATSIHLARSQSPSCISYRNGDWYLTMGGVEYRAQLIGEVVLWQNLLVARFRLRHDLAKINLVCLSDSLKRDDFRRLKVWLRIYLGHRNV